MTILRTAAAALILTAAAHAQSPARQQVATLGLDHHVKVLQADGHKLKGTITNIGDTSFTVQPRHHHPAVAIPYAQTTAVEDHSHLAWLHEGPCGGPVSLVAVTGLIVGLAIAL